MAERDNYLGKEIGNYRIQRKIASGSFGAVYLARNFHIEEHAVAIKILHDVRLGSQKESAWRAMSEQGAIYKALPMRSDTQKAHVDVGVAQLKRVLL